MVAALAVVVAALGLAMGAAAAEASAPGVTVVSAPTKVGGTVRVHLDGWEPGAVDVTICGEGGLDPAKDCARQATVTAVPAADGTALTELRVPDVGRCPCIVRASTPTNAVVATAPLTIELLPMLAPDDPSLAAVDTGPSLSVSVELVSPGGVKSRLGLDRTRELRVMVHNETLATVPAASIDVAVGRDIESGSPVAVAPVEDLLAGETRVVAVPIELPLPPVGEFVVHGSVDGAGTSVPFAATTSNLPIVPLVALVLLLLGGLALRANRLRGPRDDRKMAAGEPLSVGPANIARRPPPVPENDDRPSVPSPSSPVAGELLEGVKS